jgi:uncharacterized protein YprB with RNaseH-like and TPR domain
LSSLADRIRGIVGQKPQPALPACEFPAADHDHPTPGDRRLPSPASQFANPSNPPNPSNRPNPSNCSSSSNPESRIPNPDPLSALGGEWRANVFVVERRRPAASRHGREAVGTFAECLDAAATQASFYAGGAPARPPFVFFDLETTGLSGGAGTQVFLVGCGWFDAEGSFVTRQFLLTRFSEEPAMLQEVASALEQAGALVTFNGKSFDAPVLETRYLFHRLSWNVRGLPHVDVLHPARRFWKAGAPADVGGPFQGRHACSLAALEKQMLGARRVGDVPGFQIPARYFQFVRTGDAAPLAPVLEHNRLDLLTLAALTARLFHVTLHGPDAARDAREALALGHVYARAGLAARACDAYARAVEMTERGIVSQLIRIESLRALASAHRRARAYGDAAACWRRLLDTPGCPPAFVREATEALAVHHEHRARDLAAAKAFALRGLDFDAQPAWTRAVHHRLARLNRKLKLIEQPSSSLLS